MDEAIKVEFQRIHDEDNRQNHRLDALERLVTEIQSLTVSIHELAKDMQQMLHEQQAQGKKLDKQDERLEEQGERLDKLEQAPAKKAEKIQERIAQKVIDTAVGLIAGALVTGAVIMAAQYIH